MSLLPERPLVDHLPCASCHYDLHGLKTSGLCPECGWPINKTLEAGGLDYRWLVAIHSGVQALLVAHYVLLGSAVMCFLLPIGVCFFIILMLGGAVELGTPHPNAPATDVRSKRPARVIGAGMIACMAGVILLAGAPVLGALFIALGMALLAIGKVLLWCHFANLMENRFSRAAARGGVTLAWAYGVFASLLIFGLGVYFWPGGYNGGDIGSGLLVFGVVLWGLASGGAIITLHIASKVLREAMGISRSLERTGERHVVKEKVGRIVKERTSAAIPRDHSDE